MSRVRILSEFLSNKIAAGEIIERPASVVKELIENSIDAKSTIITIEIETRNKSLIRVSDNGIGMDKTDALLSLERYATSKIKNNTDLNSIKTLGFRGEAIPSIASISHFSMISCKKDSSMGIQIKVEGGKIKQVNYCGAPPGIMVTVENLFFNTPARKKFLKSNKTEINHIIETTTSIAIAKPNIRFKLIHNKKIIKDWPNHDTSQKRISDVIGYDLNENFITIRAKIKNIVIKGWIANPKINRSNSKSIYIFVNDRRIKNKIATSNIIAAYKERLIKGRYPISIIFIKLPYVDVDVNVHPTKNEVRFINQTEIYKIIHSKIKKTLKIFDHSKWKSNEKNRFSFSNETNSDKYFKIKHKPLERNINKTPKQPFLWEKQFFSDLTIIGQYKNTYILCESKKSIILIDQHAAHERIIFEQLKLKINNKTTTKQNLLIPEIFEVNLKEKKILTKLIPNLINYGFEIEAFGRNTFIIKAIPTLINAYKIDLLIFKLIKNFTHINITSTIKNTIHECLSIIACHNSIKSTEPLNTKQMRTILQQLDKCLISSNCPHGRPLWIEIKSSELEKNFGRK